MAACPLGALAHTFGRANPGDTVHLLRGGTYREAGLAFPAGVTVQRWRLRASRPADRHHPDG
jgi:hypothetical protein